MPNSSDYQQNAGELVEGGIWSSPNLLPVRLPEPMN